MNRNFRNFLITNLMATLGIAIIGLILFAFFLNDLFHPIYIILLVAAFGVNIAVYLISSRQNAYNKKLFLSIILSFFLRFFLYMGLAIVYFLIENRINYRLVFILSLFGLYLIYSLIEVNSLLKQIRKNK